MSLNCISLVGKSQSGTFFSDGSSGRWRTVRNINVTGYGSVPSVSVSGVLAPITLNGISFGTGRIISVNASGGGEFGQRGLGNKNWDAQIEIFEEGSIALTNFTGVSISNLKYIDSFSEDLNSSVDEDGSFKYTHSIRVKMLKADAAFDAIDAAKDVAAAIFDATHYDVQIPELLQNRNYDRAGRKYYTESFNLKNSEYSVTKNYVLAKKNDAANYTCNTSSKFVFNERGNIDVTESGEVISINGYGDLASALETEINGSFGRCSSLFSSLSGYIFGASDALINEKIVLTKTINVNAERGSYSVTYTNSKNIVTAPPKYSLEETNTISKEAGIISSTYDGQLKAFQNKSTTFNGIALYNQRKAAIGTPAGFVLRNKNATISKTGKDVSYSFSFTKDPSVSETGTFRKMEVTVVDAPATIFHKEYMIPNNTEVLVNKGENVEISTRQVTITGTLPRVNGQSVFTNIPNVLAPSLYTPIKATLINKCLQVFASLNLMPYTPIIDSSYFSNHSVSFNSNRELSISLEYKYVIAKASLSQKVLT